MQIIDWAYANMEYPWVLLLIPILVLLVYWLLKRQGLVIKEEPEVTRQKKKIRKVMVLTRTAMIILLLIALASPFIQKEKHIEGDPYILLLVDNSTSMELFEDISSELSAKLENKLNTEVKFIGSGTVSNLGDSILAELQPYSSILMLSDGNANSGADMGDVALYASKLNASINAVKLTPKNNDAHVVVYGPSKTMENADSTFTVEIGRAGNIGGVNLKVTLDGETVYDQVTQDSYYQFSRKLSNGYHRIVATIDSPDYWAENNVFYKTVRVVPQPKILLLSEKPTPWQTLLNQLYVVDTATSLPPSLKDYYTVIVNDIDATKMDAASDVLNDFVADGNGMVVVGGENSFDLGEYRGSIFETLLPVAVGAPDKKEGEVVIAVVMDISGSTGSPFGRFDSTADFEKSATIGILQGVRVDTRAAIIAFNTNAYLISEPSRIFEKAGVEGLIGRVKFGGGTNIAAGLLKAIAVLGEYPGSKNIVLLSDGKTQAKANAAEAARFAANSGIKVYTVGVGPTTDEQFMMDLADLTNGIYFRATEESKLNILFGPAEDEGERGGTLNLVALDTNHFITAGNEPNATIYGYNQVTPKDAGRLLVTTTNGEPILTVWRLGLGRVAALSTDDGAKWSGELLAGANSKLITRTVNWGIGDPERKSASFIDASDTRLNEPAVITVKSDIQPTAPLTTFYKIDEGLYSANVIPTQLGFTELVGAQFAVNYEKEFETSGLSSEMEKIVFSTGGKIFDKDDIDGMVDNAKSRAQRIINARHYVRWPFLVLAIVIFLLEIFIRRIVRKEV